MSKEKTIPDPPAHIKNWIMDEWNVVDSVSEHEISGSQGFRLGASIMYKKNQEELEERSVGFAGWLSHVIYLNEDNPGRWFMNGEWHTSIQMYPAYEKYLQSLTSKTPSI